MEPQLQFDYFYLHFWCGLAFCVMTAVANILTKFNYNYVFLHLWMVAIER